jgi:hypothetical protein
MDGFNGRMAILLSGNTRQLLILATFRRKIDVCGIEVNGLRKTKPAGVIGGPDLA